MHGLSKSSRIMFIFDFIILCLSTCLWANYFGYTIKAVCLLCSMVVFIGLTVLYLKGNYKIREYNINLKNTYLLFEGVVMMHVIPSLYLLIFAASFTNTITFLFVNIFINGQTKLKMSDIKLKFFNFVPSL